MRRHLLPVMAALLLLASAVAAQTRAVSLFAEPGHRIAPTGYGIDEYAHAGYALDHGR